MRLALIAAMDRNRLIGKNNDLPWRLPADLRWFKSTTMGKPIIMGRKTHESIGKALPGRKNIVVTRNSAFEAEGCEVVHSLNDALAASKEAEEAVVIGGAALYQEALPKAERLYLTFVDAELDGDVWFPEINFDEWVETKRDAFAPDEKNKFPYAFAVFDRKK